MNMPSEYRAKYREMLRTVYKQVEGDEAFFKYAGFNKRMVSFMREYILKGNDFCRWNIVRLRRRLFALHFNSREKSLTLFGWTIFNTKN